MDILLVDDDLDVIEGILDGVDFEALGCQRVHMARSARQAKDIMEHHDIAVLLTDIEMPGGSGLELLEWVRDSGLHTVTLFYTSFPYFDYAKKAIELHSFAYFLKPIAYPEMQEHLRRAMEEARRLRRMEQFQQDMQTSLWEEKQKFWQAYLMRDGGRLNGNLEPPEPYSPDDAFTLAAGFFSDGSEEVSRWKRYAMGNVAEELAGDQGFTAQAHFPVRDDAWCMVLKGGSQEGLFRMFRQMEDFVRQRMAGRISIYYCAPAGLEETPAAFGRLMDCLEDDVCRNSPPCAAERYVKKSLVYQSVRMREWGDRVAAGQYAQVRDEICGELDRLAAKNELGMPYIKAMRIDLMQTIHSRLQEKQISAYDLFSDERFDSLRARSLYSVEHMKRYLGYVVCTAGDYIRYTRESGSVVGKIKEYIGAHYSEDVTRSTLSKVFFLNSDYLGRLFKKKTGLSVSGYLQDVRIEEAKKLLSGTTVQVNEVAALVGYDNFSYFSHIFREKTGLTPVEYRRQSG